MAGWSGFSDEELRRLQNKDLVEPAVSGRGRKPAHTDPAEVAVSGRGRRAAPTNRSRQQLQREKALQLAVQHDLSRTIPPEQRLTKPRAQSPVTTRPMQLEETPQELSNRQNEPQSANPDTAESTEPGQMGKELDKKEVELREKSRLELLQHEQRMMEEKNKRKKALLSKTIAEKSKRTQAESVKLKRIQRELQALDDMVSCDIGILRGRIEQASWDYSMARKRYEKAEAEFVTAKLDLHKKTDLKEQLTEHLYAIIQQNEQRKARKLEELMQQLELHADEEQLELEIEVERMLQGEEPQTQACLRNSSGPESPKELQTSPSDCDSIHMPLNHQPVGSEVPASVA